MIKKKLCTICDEKGGDEPMIKKPVKETIHAKGIDITIYTHHFQDEFLSLTDIAYYKNADYPSDVITIE